MRSLLATLLLVAAAAAHAQGMYSKPYAIVERGDRADTRNEDTVAITKVDGKSTRDARRTDPIPPGKHVITLHYTSAGAGFRPEYQEFEVDLAPCTLYKVVAVYENRLGPDWKPKVYTQKIGECERKFAKKALKP